MNKLKLKNTGFTKELLEAKTYMDEVTHKIIKAHTDDLETAIMEYFNLLNMTLEDGVANKSKFWRGIRPDGITEYKYDEKVFLKEHTIKTQWEGNTVIATRNIEKLW